MESPFLDQSEPLTTVELFGGTATILKNMEWPYSSRMHLPFAWKNSLYLPTLVASLSFAFLIVRIVKKHCLSGRGDRQCLANFPQEGSRGAFSALLFFRVSRLFACLALLAVCVTAAVVDSGVSRRLNWDKEYLIEHGPQIGLMVTYLYAALLATVSLSSKSWSLTTTRHCNIVLFTTWLTFLYRDIWPKLTYTLHPEDELNAFFWTNFAILSTVAVAIPLSVPRQYKPVDPKNPMLPHPEQTASIISFLLFSYLDPIIFEAARVSHLSHRRLPPLADYDSMEYLSKKTWPYLDPFHGAKRRHLFFSLFSVFRRDFLMVAISLTVQIFANFSAPLALNRLLSYLETVGGITSINPCVWVSALFLGPVIASIAYQQYMFYITRTSARVEGLLVQLIFEHSLRIRLRAETPSEGDSDSVTRSATADEPRAATSEAGSVTENASSSTSLKGKSKGENDLPQPNTKPKTSNLVGKINTLVTVDVENVGESKDFMMLLIQVPLEIALALAFLYTILGWSGFVGFASMIAMFLLPGYLTSQLQKVVSTKMSKTDARVQAVTESTSVLRMIKLFGWEPKISKQLQDKRADELSWLWKEKLIQLALNIINFFIPIVTMVLTYATYTIVMKQPLNASKVFSSIAVFNILRSVLHSIAFFASQLTKGKVSLDRIGNFLQETELLDSFDDNSKVQIPSLQPQQHEGCIGFSSAMFAWSKDDNSGSITSSRQFRLRIDEKLVFKRNCVNLVIGPTGSGKTSLLMALLGEMHFIPAAIDSWYNLPREGGVAYAAQESWVQNETIRENILFGADYDEERYKKVVYQCALERDLELFEAGDATEVGEKGLTLSGGQKARLTLARALYSSAEILLLDDILAALDVHTSKWIADKCLRGDLIKGRTVILVTHNVALTNPIADFVVSVGRDGTVQAVGSDALLEVSADPDFAHELELQQEVLELEKRVVDAIAKDEIKPDGKLILAEEIVEGRVTWSTIKLYISGLSAHPLLFMATIMLTMTFTHVANSGGIWFLGYWGSQYENHNRQNVPVFYYLLRYILILTTAVLVYAVGQSLFYSGTIRASQTINRQLINAILGSTVRWLDETPTARILTRFTQDIANVDGSIPLGFGAVLELALCMAVKLAGPVIFSPVFLLPGILVTVIGLQIGNIYLKAQMSVRREQSNAKAPVMSHFGAAINGLVSIRAYGAQDALKQESVERINHYTMTSRTSYNLNRWIGIRIDFLGACFTAALATYLLTRQNVSAANTGFSLSMSLEFCSMILWLVRYYNEFEVQCNSLERIQGYLDIEHEPKATADGAPPAAWPTSGELVVRNLSARYSLNGPKVLHGLSFRVKAGERIGIVGRTGSGKSSLTLALLRCIPTEGEVYYDGLPTGKLNLDALRSSVTIIPQIPELLSGTLRRNLDPFEQHDDAVLNDALRAAGLFSLQEESDEVRITLDTLIASAGGNLSVGQRQIIALARAIVRNSRLLILDEATSAIDYKTDAIIQRTLRRELSSDVTVLTVAHRLQSIMDADKVMVLDAGRIIEFESPQELLRKKGGAFKSMVDSSEDRVSLYRMAENRASSSVLM